MTTFTRGGHGYAEEEGLSSMASPQHAGYDDGAHLHHMDSAQQPEMTGAPGGDYIITCAIYRFLDSIFSTQPVL